MVGICRDINHGHAWQCIQVPLPEKGGMLAFRVVIVRLALISDVLT